jgi:hypothetical protein
MTNTGPAATHTIACDAPVYLSAADDAVGYLVGQEGFNRSLLHNLLFGSPVVVHESFFFNSTVLLGHVTGVRGESLFERAAREGLVLPAYRSRDTSNLVAAHDDMRRNSYPPGSVPYSLDDTHYRIIRAIDHGIDVGKVAPVYPIATESSGDLYERAMRSFFFSEAPPALVASDDWNALSEWRDLIDEASERTKKRGQLGLQRAELVHSICNRLNVPGDRVFMPLDQLVLRCQNPKQAAALADFWKSMNQIHWLNMSDTFGIHTSLPGYEIEGQETRDGLDREQEHLTYIVDLPSYESLMRVDPNKLLDVRRDVGKEYRDARHSVISSSGQLYDVVEPLRRYGRSLCQLADDSRPTVWSDLTSIQKLSTSLSAVCAVAQAIATSYEHLNSFAAWSGAGVSLFSAAAPFLRNARAPRNRYRFEFVI